MSFEEVASTPVSSVKRREPIIVEPGTSLGEVVERLAKHNRGSVLVAQGGALVGIFTEANLVRQVDLDSDWRSKPVGDYMTDKVKTATLDTSIAAGLLMMTAGGFRHLPILDESGSPVSIISTRDIIAHLAHCYPKEFVNLPPSPELETKKPWGG